MSTVIRVFVEKRPGFDIEAGHMLSDLRENLGLASLEALRLVNRYDISGISRVEFLQARDTILSEPNVDRVFEETLPVDEGDRVFAMEYLPGQYDQRADSAAQCVQLLTQGERPQVLTARVVVLKGAVSEEEFTRIQHYLVNPVESRIASLEKPESLDMKADVPADVARVTGFTSWDENQMKEYYNSMGFAMTLSDLEFCRDYFRDQEHRDPSVTELRVIDTYWSDHCRHTTFLTRLEQVEIEKNAVSGAIEEALKAYYSARDELYGADTKRPVSLMDMALAGMKLLKKQGKIPDLDVSEEINACSIEVPVTIDGKTEQWLVQFKNETHNHPTEIEPFGGAATCVGGAIRDPLSGRSYVYQAMRVTGAGDPTVPVEQTLAGKLPQRKIVTEAAAGYSSYGNQIGLATGQVSELYHPGYVAKRMEVGAVVGAAPAKNVCRECPAPGDKIVLLGGRTGRDGIGGATGSSKAQSTASVEECGAEVQKGNAPVERKLQRLFRRTDACRLIKRCNDFGAGGVSVAIGELCDGIAIDLDVVPKKYDGLDGTELAIAESQERMAVALAAADVDEFMGYAREENLEATVVATVTEEPRMRMTWRGGAIVDLSRAFLSSNGAPKHQKAHVPVQGGPASLPAIPGAFAATLTRAFSELASDLNVCSNKGLSERFDSTIGAATVLMPFGGSRQLTPSQAMVAKFPVFGETSTCSAMAWGFNPYLMEKNQFAGAYLSVVESVAKLVATGFARERAYLSFQEYFEKLREDADRWGKPVAAVLGALMAQVDLGVGAIGGKDSMSGSFEDLDVPPTLISFAVSTGSVDNVISPEFKKAGDTVALLRPLLSEDGVTPDRDSLLALFDLVEAGIRSGAIVSAATPGFGGAAEAVLKMCVGNGKGLQCLDWTSAQLGELLFSRAYGGFVVEVAEDAWPLAGLDEVAYDVDVLGAVMDEYRIAALDEMVGLGTVQEAWESGIEGVFPYRTPEAERAHAPAVEALSFEAAAPHAFAGPAIAKPRVIIPVFPGNNCEYDTARAFERAGAVADVFVINNLTPAAVAESTRELARRIRESQIVMIPGGFSGGDEPDGSAKFITAFFRAPEVTEAVRELLQKRDGLMLGICNGFQALVKLGLVPYGDIRPMDADCATLTFNTIGRHQSRLVRTRVASSLSPWLSECQVGDVHTVAISHGEGRFVAPQALLHELVANGQVATQYVDEAGIPSMDLDVNPNGSLLAIEGITSPDGRVFGKMGHSERSGAGLYKNVPGNLYQPIFEGGVRYFG